MVDRLNENGHAHSVRDPKGLVDGFTQFFHGLYNMRTSLGVPTQVLGGYQPHRLGAVASAELELRTNGGSKYSETELQQAIAQQTSLPLEDVRIQLAAAREMRKWLQLVTSEVLEENPDRWERERIQHSLDNR